MFLIYTENKACTSITKTCLYNVDLLKPYFYTVKLVFTGVYIIFLISSQNIDCGYSLEPPRQCFEQKYVKYQFVLNNIHFLVVKLSVDLNRLVISAVFIVIFLGITEPILVSWKIAFRLTLSILGKIFNRRHYEIYYLFIP